jgi:hypothetical protein
MNQKFAIYGKIDKNILRPSEFATRKKMFGIAPGAEELIPQPQGLAAVQHWFMP